MERCCYPGCNYVAEIITKVHCRMEHNMERSEVERLYGKSNATVLKFSGKVQKWTPTDAQYLEAELNGISRKTLHERGLRGWNTDEAVKVPVLNISESARMGGSVGNFNPSTWRYKNDNE